MICCESWNWRGNYTEWKPAGIFLYFSIIATPCTTNSGFNRIRHRFSSEKKVRTDRFRTYGKFGAIGIKGGEPLGPPLSVLAGKGKRLRK
jgi:hypothetical protein